MTLLRSYPSVTDFIYDVFGANIPLPIQSFGFFVAIAFVVAAYLLMMELKRKEKMGLIAPTPKKVRVGEPVSSTQLFVSGLIGFIAGFKLLAALLNYSSCAANPQEFVFSFEGNIIGGLIGAAIAVFIRYRDSQKRKLDKPKWETVLIHPYQRIGDIVAIAAGAGFLGAKVFNFLEVPEDFTNFINDPGSNVFSGLTIYGGLIFGTAALIYYCKKSNLSFLHLGDALAPGLMLAYGIGRIGCQVSGDGDWGIANTMDKPGWLGWLPDNLWSSNYAHNILNEGALIPGCEGDHCYALIDPVFPTPIYETMMAILIFGLLWSLRKRINAPGAMLALYLIFNGIERFFIEKIRVNVKYQIGDIQITQAEIISVVFFIIGIVSLIYFMKRHKRAKELKNDLA